MNCKICESQTLEPIAGSYCENCWNNIVHPAYDHVESVPPDYPNEMTWHGWALREAFIAGAKHQMHFKP